MGQTLAKHGIEDVFGIYIIHTTPIGLDQIWLEDSDSRNRVLILSIGAANHGIADITETNWTFNSGSECECVAAEKNTLVANEDSGNRPNKDKPWKDKPWKDKRWKEKPFKRKELPLVPEPGGEPKPEVMCTWHCRTHCHMHCHNHCRQHCMKHRP